MFQTLKGSLQTYLRCQPDASLGSFKPSKDRYKHLRILIVHAGQLGCFKPSKDRYKLFFLLVPREAGERVSNPQRIATNCRNCERELRLLQVSNPQRIATNPLDGYAVRLAVAGFKPSKDRYKPDRLSVLYLETVLFQTLKGSLQTHVKFGNISILSAFQTLKGSLQTLKRK